MENWVAVIVAEKPTEGKAVKAKADGKPVLLAKVNDKLYAMDNVCPHLGCFLHRGDLSGHLITCPCHDWVFDIRTGEFTAAPEIKIPVFPVKTKNGEILILMEGLH
ncbi:MAG: Rieske (2Fe-2S) protein [Bacillota bacterium]|nr:Rieske (2Fe-2S) protein [Bacillota bacterium]MDW7683120.1 Rieske (2Fe-2S) protein [Bacillota bacterium]